MYHDNGQPYVHQEFALYIKNSTQLAFNIIYIIGGDISKFEQSAQFLQIEIPKDPYTQLKKITIKKLPDLLQVGHKYHGTFYEGQIYIFYGQQKKLDPGCGWTEQMLNVVQVFKNTWSNLNLVLVPRYDGSSFTVTINDQFSKCIFFYGGVSNVPKGQQNCNTTQQTNGQIFVCKDQCFFGGYVTFTLKFPLMEVGSKQDRVVCTPIFSIPYQYGKQLLLSGEYLNENLIDKKRQIFIFDWIDGEITLNDLFCIEPQEQKLTPYEIQTSTGLDNFTPVHDIEGCLIYGNFYTIYQKDQYINNLNTSIPQLLIINQTNGFFKTLPYDDSQNQNQMKIQSLPDRNNQVLKFNIQK